jgi:DNA-binding response OmpR family regulator
MTTNKKIKILIIEDDTFLSNMYATKLRMCDFEVFTCQDGDIGLDYIKEEKPDIVLLDVMMPRFNGYNVLKVMRSDENMKDIPVVLLTNLSQKRHVDKGIALGATDYLVKAHFMPTEVIEKIKQTIKENVRV